MLKSVAHRLSEWVSWWLTDWGSFINRETPARALKFPCCSVKTNWHKKSITSGGVYSNYLPIWRFVDRYTNFSHLFQGHYFTKPFSNKSNLSYAAEKIQVGSWAFPPQITTTLPTILNLCYKYIITSLNHSYSVGSVLWDSGFGSAVLQFRLSAL